MLGRLDAAFAKEGYDRGDEFQIIVTPPIAMSNDAMEQYEELGVDRLFVNLRSQRADRIKGQIEEIEGLQKIFA